MNRPSEIPICWKRESVGKAISIKAKIDEKQTHYFLASHSPMNGIQDEKSKRKIAEEELYKNLVTSSQRDKQVVIYGEPGTGKSHLVHWLKLRFDYGVELGEFKKIVPVLIERRSGSLKDALTQLIEQLGESFQKYLDPVQQALEKLSDATARQMLVGQISLELGPRWTDRGRDKLDKRLKHLGQACRAEGFGGWLCRDAGVVEETINLLVESSQIRDREDSPKFCPDDLLVKDRFRTRRKNSQEVLDLIDELDDSQSLRELAAEHLNEAMKNAIGEMVGLSGANLRRVFDSIREDLASEDKQLALFIEDVSAMSELDVEVVNALEPQDRNDLCPLIAVLGMTHTGYAKLRDNQKQRIEFVYRLDGETTTTWSKDKGSLARFIARYLNSIRLDEGEVRKIADDRRASKADVSKSKCTECVAKELCHSTFGFVDIDGVEIGLYPFSRATAPRVLELIENDESSSYSANQRGLLIRLLSPVMSDVESLKQNNFPNDSSLPIRVTDPYYWTAFQQQYLGNYSEAERERVRILAGLWIEGTDDPDRAAGLLKPYLVPLQLPAYTKEAMKVVPAPISGETKIPVSHQPAIKKTKEKVKEYLDSLSAWYQGEPLKNERYFRDLLSSLVRNCIRWENYLQPAQFLTRTWDVVKGRDFIRIEGQISSPKRLWFEFPRDESTRSLLEALCRYDQEGQKSWVFELGQTHKRVVANWVRNNEPQVVETLAPHVETSQAIKTAVEFLSLYHTVRTRSKLPQKSISELMGAIYSKGWEVRPIGLSEHWNAILKELDERYEQVVTFLKNESAVRQGKTGGIKFISPLAVLENVTEFNESPQVSGLSEDYGSGFWKTRFAGLPTNQFSNLSQAIAEERCKVTQFVEKARSDLTSVGFNAEDGKADLIQLFEQLVGLNESIRLAKVVLPDQEYEELVKQNVFTEKKMEMANALAKAEKVAMSDDPFDVLTFDPDPIRLCCHRLSIVSKRMIDLDNYITPQEDEIKKDGDPELISNQMFDALGQFADLNEEILEMNHVKDS